MKKHVMLSLIVVFTIFFVGCTWFDGSSHYTGNSTDLYRVALYSFPMARDIPSNAFAKENEIETDDYGRELQIFHLPSFGFYNALFQENDAPEWLYAAVIMQKCDDRKIYYYEDACFMLGRATAKGILHTFSDDIEINEEKMEAFKKMNDWNQPLQLNKCSSRLYSKSGKDYDGMKDAMYAMDTMKIEDAIQEYEQGKGYSTGFTDMLAMVSDADNHVLYFVEFIVDGSVRDSLFVIGSRYAEIITEENILEIESLDFADSLHELKIRNGWNFTDCPGE